MRLGLFMGSHTCVENAVEGGNGMFQYNGFEMDVLFSLSMNILDFHFTVFAHEKMRRFCTLIVVLQFYVVANLVNM